MSPDNIHNAGDFGNDITLFAPPERRIASFAPLT
jgi:hypothetical protein